MGWRENIKIYMLGNMLCINGHYYGTDLKIVDKTPF
jgi:hypothetical protein